MGILTKLLLLFAGHALCDYPLQGDFLAKGKNHRAPLPGVPWYQCLLGHALIHAGMVFLITRSLWFALAELVIHSLTDYAKCDGRFGNLPMTPGVQSLSPEMQRIMFGNKSSFAFNIDQAIHYTCKVLWAVL